jgi:hypothetical protein
VIQSIKMVPSGTNIGKEQLSLWASAVYEHMQSGWAYAECMSICRVYEHMHSVWAHAQCMSICTVYEHMHITLY